MKTVSIELFPFSLSFSVIEQGAEKHLWLISREYSSKTTEKCPTGGQEVESKI